MDLRRCLILAAALLATMPGILLAQQVDLLPADQAFQVAARQDAPGRIAVDFRIAPGYILYRDRFAFAADAPAVRVVNPRFPAPAEKFDPVLNQRVSYYRDHVTVLMDLAGTPQSFRLKVQAQGCAVEAGVCYPPITKEFQVPAWLRQGGAS